MRRGYVPFEHTADAGVEVRARSLPRLFENASAALFGLICDRRRVRAARAIRVAVRGASLEDLLVRWLSELLFLLETRGLLFRSFEVASIDAGKFSARGVARGEPLDRERHRPKREVKAVTYHQMRLERVRGVWRVRIVFDI